MSTVTPGIIYLQPMQCGTCGTVLQIKEVEETTVIVNVQGLPVNADTTSYSVKAVCPKCGRTYPVEKQGMYFSLVNNMYRICPHLKLQNHLEKIGFGLEV